MNQLGTKYRGSNFLVHRQDKISKLAIKVLGLGFVGMISSCSNLPVKKEVLSPEKINLLPISQVINGSVWIEDHKLDQAELIQKKSGVQNISSYLDKIIDIEGSYYFVSENDGPNKVSLKNGEYYQFNVEIPEERISYYKHVKDCNGYPSKALIIEVNQEKKNGYLLKSVTNLSRKPKIKYPAEYASYVSAHSSYISKTYQNMFPNYDLTINKYKVFAVESEGWIYFFGPSPAIHESVHPVYRVKKNSASTVERIDLPAPVMCAT